MAKMRGGDQFVVRLIFAFLFLNVVTAYMTLYLRSDGRIDVPYNEFSSTHIDQVEQRTFGKNYPVVTVEFLPMNQLRATQRRFQIDQPGVNVTEYTWNISLRYLTKAGNNGRRWLNKTEDVFDIPLNSSDDWIVFNVGDSRECRVKYGDVLWSRITKQLKENHTELPEDVRHRLFMDARNLAKVGLVGYDKVLDLIRYASKDRWFVLWYHIYDFVNFFGRMIYDTTSFFPFQRFMLNVTSSLRDEMTFKAPTDVFEIMKPRSSMGYLKGLAYNLKTREKRQEVLEFFDNYPKANATEKSIILDTIDRNIRWRDRNLAIIDQWFKQNEPY